MTENNILGKIFKQVLLWHTVADVRMSVVVRKLNVKFCSNRYNFEDRRDLDRSMVCAGGHPIEGNCEDFIDRNQKLRTCAQGR